MNRLQFAAAIISAHFYFLSAPAIAQSQQDVDNLQGLLPWAEALDKRIEEKRQRESQKVMDEIAQMEQSIKDREAREAAKKAELQKRAAAIKQWNPKDNLPPSLRAGEHIVLTRNGCRMVIAGDPNAILEVPGTWDAQGKQGPSKRMSHKDYFASMLWSGDCELGVADGFGALAEPENMARMLEYESAYSFGRALGAMKQPSIKTGYQFEIMIFKPGQKPITQQMREEPYTPLWGDYFLKGEPSTSLTYDDVTASTTKYGCLGLQGLTKKKFSGCSHKNDYPVYGISVRTPGVEFFNSVTYCPNPKTAKGCEALWYQLAGPTIEKHKAAWLVAENSIKQEVLAIQQFSAPWLAEHKKKQEAKERAAELAAETVYKTNPSKLSAQQIEVLRSKYTRERNGGGLNAMDEIVWKKEQAAKVAQEKALAANAALTKRPTTSIATNATAGISCAEAVSQLYGVMNASGNERQFLDTASGNQMQEQNLWVTNWYNKAVNQLPQCKDDPAYRKRFADDLAATQRNCPGRTNGPANCTNGANYFLDNNQLDAALRKLTGSAVSASSSKPSYYSGDNCTTYEQCVQVENTSGLASKLDGLPNNNVNLKTRGIIAVSDFMIKNYQQCQSDTRCQTIINQYQKLKTDTLLVCEKSSTDPSTCTQSPF